MNKKPTYEELESKISVLKEELKNLRDRRKSDLVEIFAVYDKIPVMIHSIDRNGFIINVNSFWLQQLGYDREEVIGKKSTDFLTDKSRNYALKSIIPAFFKNGYCFDVPYQMICKSGKIIDILLSANSVRDEKNDIISSIAVVTNITEQRKSERALRASEGKFRLFHENTNDIVWTLDLTGKLSYVSPSVENFLGYSVEEHLNQTFSDFLTPDSTKNINQVIGGLSEEIRKGMPVESDQQKIFSVEFIRKDGSKGWAEIKSKPLRNEKDQIIGISGITSNITERKKSKDALIESEEKYRLMIENTSELIVKIDKNGNTSFASSSYCEKFGIGEEDIFGMKFQPFIDKKDARKMKKIIEDLHYPPHSYYFEHQSVTKEGLRWLGWSFKAIIDDNNNISSFVGVGRDITAQKEAGAALHESERRYRTIAETAISGITRADINDNITYANKAFCNMLGYTQNEILGMNIARFIHQEDREIFEKESAQRMYGVYSVYEIRFVTKTNNIIHVLISASPLMDSAGNLLEVMAVLVDITKLKDTEKKLKEADKLKSAFLANMSHEIRNPMNGIIGFADLLRFPDLTEEQKNEYIDLISDSCNVLLNLIEDIIDISKIEAGQLVIKEAKCYLNEVINNLYRQFNEKKVHDDKGHIDIKKGLGIEDSNLQIITDAYRLRQILSNLIENAFKFTKKGFIEFGYTVQGTDKLLFYVKDTGIGLPEDKIDVIFDRFRQVDEETAIRKFGGAGLGLSISKSLTELLGGEMWVESVLDKGSVFYFTLPYKRVHNVDIEKFKTKRDFKDINWEDKTFLIAEDEDTNYKFLEKVLQKTKAKLIWAKDGQEAIDQCKKNPQIDLVLLDIKMPNVSGYEAVKVIKKLRRNLPVIAQTAYAMAEEKEKSLRMGCDDYITKPIKPELLLTIIEENLKGWEIVE